MARLYQSDIGSARPVGPSLARADTANALADALGSFRQAVGQYASARQAGRGAQEGAEAGLQGPPQKKSSLTAFGRAYNTAAESAYLAQQNIDIEDNLARIEDESQADPEKFDQLSEGYIKGLVKGAPPELRPSIQLVANARAVDGRRRVNDQFRVVERERQRVTIMEGLDVMVEQARRLVTSDDPNADAALEVLKGQIVSTVENAQNEGLFSPAQAYELRNAYQDRLTSTVSEAVVDEEVSRIMGGYQADIFKGDKLLSALNDADLDEDTKTRIRSDVRTKLNLMQDERKRIHVEDIAGLHKDLADGVPSDNAELQALRLYRRGALETTQYQSLVSAIERARVDAAEKDALAASALAVYERGIPLDPKDSEASKAMNQLFARQISGVERGSPEYQNMAIEMARRTNIIPEDAISWARTITTAGEPESSAVAANFLQRVHDANPASFNYIADEKLKSFALQVSESMNAGAAPMDAVAVVHRTTYELTDAEVKTFDDRYRTDKNAKDNPDELQSLLDSDDRYDRTWFGGAPDAPIAMQAEFERGVSRYYKYTGGDIDKARKLAWRDVTATWGYTKVNGSPSLMKWAPEQMYPGLTSEMVRKDIDAIAPGAVLIEAPETGRTNGLDWQLGVVNEYGAFDVLLNDQNRPLKYRLPVADTDFRALKEAEEAEQIQKAKELSDRRKREIQILTEMGQAGDEDAARLVETLRAARN